MQQEIASYMNKSLELRTGRCGNRPQMSQILTRCSFCCSVSNDRFTVVVAFISEATETCLEKLPDRFSLLTAQNTQQQIRFVQVSSLPPHSISTQCPKFHPTYLTVDEYLESKHQDCQNSCDVKASFSLTSR